MESRYGGKEAAPWHILSQLDISFKSLLTKINPFGIEFYKFCTTDGVRYSESFQTLQIPFCLAFCKTSFCQTLRTQYVNLNGVTNFKLVWIANFILVLTSNERAFLANLYIFEQFK